MAFMVPVVRNDWDLYGTKAAGRRASRQPASETTSLRSSRASSGSSRGASFGSARGAEPAERRPGRSASGDSAHSAPRSVTFGPPSPPRGGPPGAGKASFHSKVVDKLKRVLQRGDKDGARQP